MKKIKIGDNVKVILGSNKGQIGQVKSLKGKKNKVIIEGINKKFKHVKPIKNVKVGKILKFDAPIDISNIMLCDKNGVKCKIEFIFKNGIKLRVLKS